MVANSFVTFLAVLSYLVPIILAQANNETCAAVLFVYFGPGGEIVSFALSEDGRHFNTLNSGKPIPALMPSINGTSIRDPFVRKSPADNKWHMVATNGQGFGGTDTILHWSSSDLISWSQEQRLPVMAKFINDVAYDWAPEWVWDSARQEHVVFWATQWKTGQGHFNSSCSNNLTSRFAFWAVTTKDFQTYSDPFILYDPHCMTSWYAPMHYGDGGIDGDILQGPDGMYHFYYKDSRAPEPTGVDPMQKTSGIRIAKTQDVQTWDTAPLAPIVGPWGTEGPELLVVNDTIHLYFDCSFQPTPPGYPRPPYGLAIAKYPDLADPSAWVTVPGSCTGDNASSVSFPKGATHGSFVCVTMSEYEALLKSFPP
eukprot:m.232610 g.232610  ORF g.232610 m.232610 type:complete len:369 (-) comp16021_c0_seq10:32-1138(-)